MGGAPFNVAAIASLKGVKATMITAVGKDERGKQICAAAQKMVNLHCQINEYKTGTVKVVINEKKIPTFVIDKDKAYDYIVFDDKIKNICSDAKFFCFGTLAQRNIMSRETLRKILEVTPAVTIYDFNYRDDINEWQSIFRESLNYTDILKVNEEELELLKTLFKCQSDEMFLNHVINHYNLKYVFVTRGDKGASLYSGKTVIHKNAIKVKVVDTTGCGDAFTAGIVYALLNHFDDEQVLECGVRVAAKIATVKGAVPEKEEVV